jgi:hypothetical protein
MGEEFRPVAPIDPTNLRPLLFLDVAHEIMRSPDWSHRAVTVVMESHTRTTRPGSAGSRTASSTRSSTKASSCGRTR